MMLTSEQARARLPDESESLLALALLGQEFRAYAVRHLLSLHHCSSGARYEMLVSALTRHDLESARIFLNDWTSRLPTALVYKWVPGDHFYALTQKFDTLSEAIHYLREAGYAYGGIRERHVYPHGGD